MSKPKPPTSKDPAGETPEPVTPDAAGAPAAEAAAAEQAAGPPADAEQDPQAALAQERDQWRDKFLRSAAELDNYRKRVRRELAQARDQGVAELATGLLEVIDNLERALAAVPEEDKGHGLGQGVEMVLGQLHAALATFGIRPLEPVGERFDPHFHEAILEVDQADAAPGTVLQEARRGYVMGERLLRASQVLVAKASADEPAADPAGDGPDAAEADPADRAEED